MLRGTVLVHRRMATDVEAAHMQDHPQTAAEDLDRLLADPGLELLVDVVIGHAVVMAVNLDVVVGMDPNLLQLADEIASENSQLGARRHEMKAAYTEGAIGIKAGLSCLTFVNYTSEGLIPDWHKPSDVFENVDFDVVQRTAEFVWKLIQRIDSD